MDWTRTCGTPWTSQTQEKIQDTGVSLVMAVVESLAQSILYAALFLVSFVD